MRFYFHLELFRISVSHLKCVQFGCNDAVLFLFNAICLCRIYPLNALSRSFQFELMLLIFTSTLSLDTQSSNQCSASISACNHFRKTIFHRLIFTQLMRCNSVILFSIDICNFVTCMKHVRYILLNSQKNLLIYCKMDCCTSHLQKRNTLQICDYVKLISYYIEVIAKCICERQ